MNLLKTFASLALCLPVVLLAQHRPVTVASDGSGDYKTIQAALDAAGDNQTIRIRPGTYFETLHITQNGIHLIGLGAKAQDTVLSAGHSAGDSGGTSKSASVTITGDDFQAENLTVENTFTRTHALTQEGSQAVALRITGDRGIFRNVRFLGFQDTLYADSKTCHDLSNTGPCRASRQYFVDCYIEGHVDFIFGDAKAVFENCELHSLAHPVSHVTAQSKKYPAEDSGYVFDHCRLTAEPGADNVFLGRPWRGYSTVIFLNSELGRHINPKGWEDWKHDGVSSLNTMYYAEYNSTGPGANPGNRIPQSHQLTAQEASRFAPALWLSGTDGWNPTKK